MYYPVIKIGYEDKAYKLTEKPCEYWGAAKSVCYNYAVKLCEQNKELRLDNAKGGVWLWRGTEQIAVLIVVDEYGNQQ